MIIIADLPYKGLVLRQGFRRILSALSATDADSMRQNPLPRMYDCVRNGKLRYEPEPAALAALLRPLVGANPTEGVEFFDSPYRSIVRGTLDCDDAVRWRGAELINDGEPCWPAVITRRGTDKHHVVLRRRDGALEDPAQRAQRK